MNNIFSTEEVTVIRRKGNFYTTHEIITCPLLSGGLSDEARVRSNVIARLRKDPTVVLVLEGRDGKCEETVECRDGFSIAVNLYEDPGRESVVTVRHNGINVFSETYSRNGYNEFVNSEEEDVLDGLKYLMGLIDDEDYTLFEELDPELAAKMKDGEESEEELTLYDAAKVLDRNGYETESIRTGEVVTPVLFVFENEVMLLGSRLFAGTGSLYVDMKCIPEDLTRDAAQDILARFRKEVKDIRTIEWEDGSWSFRVDLGWSDDEDNFLSSLNEAFRKFNGVAEWLRRQKDFLYDFNGPQAKRHLFIHEVIAEHTKLRNIRY